MGGLLVVWFFFVYTVGARGEKWDKVERRMNFRRSPYMKDLEQMFLGQYEHTVDEKGRLTIPARYRELLEDGAYITQGMDPNLLVLPTALFDQMYHKMSEKSFTDLDARMLRRLLFSRASQNTPPIDLNGGIFSPKPPRSCRSS